MKTTPFEMVFIIRDTVSEKKEPAAEGGQDLRRLKRSVSILFVCLLVQGISFIILAWRYFKIVQVLGLVTESIRLLAACIAI